MGLFLYSRQKNVFEFPSNFTVCKGRADVTNWCFRIRRSGVIVRISSVPLKCLGKFDGSFFGRQAIAQKLDTAGSNSVCEACLFWSRCWRLCSGEEQFRWGYPEQR